MKVKVCKIIIGVSFTMLVAILLIFSYYMIVDIETKAPKDAENKYNLEVEKFLGRNVFIITPKNKPKTNLKILYFHGGAYMAEATTKHWEFIEQLANDTGATVILPDYPLTPKYKYKDVFNMVVPLYKEIQEKVDVSNELIIMGDSAGGGLSLALLERLSEEMNIKMPKKTILISPWLDVRLNNPEIEKVEQYDEKLNKESLKLAGIAYAGDEGINSYMVNPIDGDLTKIKNLTIFIGENDILNPDVHKLKKMAEEINVDIDVREYKEAGHIWIIDKDSNKEIVEKAYNDLIYITNEK